MEPIKGMGDFQNMLVPQFRGGFYLFSQNRTTNPHFQRTVLLYSINVDLYFIYGIFIYVPKNEIEIIITFSSYQGPHNRHFLDQTCRRSLHRFLELHSGRGYHI